MKRKLLAFLMTILLLGNFLVVELFAGINPNMQGVIEKHFDIPLEKFEIFEGQTFYFEIPYFKGDHLGRSNVPAGALALMGTFRSDTQWELQLLNIGVGTLTNITAGVLLMDGNGTQLLDTTSRPRSLGSLGAGGRIFETFNSLGRDRVDSAIVSVSFTQPTGVRSTMPGLHNRGR